MGEDVTLQQGQDGRVEKDCADAAELEAFLDAIPERMFPLALTINSKRREETAFFSLNQPLELRFAKFHMRMNAKDNTGPWTVSVRKKKNGVE